MLKFTKFALLMKVLRVRVLVRQFYSKDTTEEAAGEAYYFSMKYHLAFMYKITTLRI